jgi:hypothetical protein
MHGQSTEMRADLEVRDFIARHGGLMKEVAPGRFVFADGAMLVNKQDGFGPRPHEPPPARRDVLANRRLFYEGRLATFVDAFNRLKRALLGELDYETRLPIQYRWDEKLLGPAPQPAYDGVAALTRLKDLAGEHRAELDKIIAEQDALPENVARREEEARQRRQKEQDEARDRAARERIAAISLGEPETSKAALLLAQTNPGETEYADDR